MKYLSVTSGIEAATVAWHPLGWAPVAFAEIDPFASAALAHHYPTVPNLGDLTRWREWPDKSLLEADVLIGGTPCQSFSVAGLRLGMEDDRGNLALQFVELANAIDHLRRAAGRPPCWIVWENVPGVFSDKGNAFGAILAGLVGSDTAIERPIGRNWHDAGVVSGPGRCAAWRVLDAQHFGLAQRRRRVFVLARGGAGDWSAPDALLPVTESVQWHPAPSREAGQRTAGALIRGAGERSGWRVGADEAAAGHVVSTLDASYGRLQGDSGQDANHGHSHLVPVISPALKARDSKGPSSDGDGDGAPLIPMTSHTLRADGFDASEDGTGRGTPLVPMLADPICANEASTYAQAGNNPGKLHNVVGFSAKDHGADASDIAPTLRAGGHDKSHASGGVMPAVAFTQNQREEVRELDVAGALGAIRRGDAKNETLIHATAVRRLTPRECESLQGFPQDHTLIPYRGKPASDGPRYKALGNSMAVPCIRYLGERIEAVS